VLGGEIFNGGSGGSGTGMDAPAVPDESHNLKLAAPMIKYPIILIT
jgi:hypothetical protein